MRRASCNSSTNHAGFTLLELVLALCLSVVLIYLISSALHMAIRHSTHSRGEIEQARIVEGVISHIRRDIENAAIVQSQDVSDAMSLAEAGAAFDVDSIDTETIGSNTNGGSGSGSGTSSMQSEDDIPLGPMRRAIGVYGTLEELTIDVVQEKPQLEIDPQGMVIATSGLGGITTIKYALGEGTSSLGLHAIAKKSRQFNGLVRYEMNRDMLNWAEQMGSDQAPPVLIAPEVRKLQFRYFDGVDALETWDTSLSGSLPLAIEVSVWVLEYEREPDEDQVTDRIAEEPYVVTIALPSVWNPNSSADAMMMDDSTGMEDEEFAP